MTPLASILIFILIQAQGKADNVEIVSGAFINEIKSPIFYSSFVPIIHEFVTPTWREDDLRLKWTGGRSTNCNTSDSHTGSWANAACTSVYHYNQILSKFHAKTIWNIPGRSKTPVVESIYGEDYKLSCDEIALHFSTSQVVNSKGWIKYWKALTNCPIGESVQLQPSKRFSTIDLTKLDSMLDIYYTRFVSSLSSYTNMATLTNAYSAYQAVALVEHSMEMTRWRDAVSECESQRLPRSLVDETTLSSALTEATNKITRKHFNLSMSETDSYYSLPLSNCIFSNHNNSYVIRTLAPVISSRSSFKLIELKSIPFALKFNSSADTNLICNLEGIEGKYIVDSVTNNLLTKTECKSLDLCFIPEKGSLPIVDPCIAAVFENNTEMIKKLCKSSCSSIPTKHFPFFRRLSSDKYSVAGSSGLKLEIFLNCHAIPYKVISPNQTGALEITLPCYCKIAYRSEELHSYQPCGSNLEIKYIQPLVQMTLPETDTESVMITTSSSTAPTTTSSSEPDLEMQYQAKANQDFEDSILNLNKEVDQLKQDKSILWLGISISFVMIFLTIIVLIWSLLSVRERLANCGPNGSKDRSASFNDRVVYQNPGKGFEDPIMLMH